MIIRRNRLNPSSKDVSFTVSFGPADVKRFMRDYIGSFPTTLHSLEPIRKYTFQEADCRHWAEFDGMVFGSIESPWREQLSLWLWTQWQAAGYFKPSATPGEFFLSDRALSSLPLRLRKKGF